MGNFLVTAAIVNNHNNICSKRARAKTSVKNSSKYYELAPRETDYSHTFPTFLHQLLLKEVIQVCISVEGDNAIGVVYCISLSFLMFTSPSTPILNFLHLHFIIFYAKRCRNWRILSAILRYFAQKCLGYVFRCAGYKKHCHSCKVIHSITLQQVANLRPAVSSNTYSDHFMVKVWQLGMPIRGKKC